MRKKQTLNKLLNILSPDATQVDFSDFDSQISSLKNNLKEKITVKTLANVQVQLERFKAKLDFQPLIQSVHSIIASFENESQRLSDLIEQKTLELQGADLSRMKDVKTEISDLKFQLSTLEEVRKLDIEHLQSSIPSLQDIESRFGESMIELSARLDALEEAEAVAPQEIKDWQEIITNLRTELMNRIASLGGGSMNRQIFVGGVDPLLKYTDINFKAGSNVTITYQNNETTKRVDVTIASSGGGGGSTRVITSITLSQTAGSTSGTDYVYLCSGTLTLTLPTTVSNTNLYTIKNIGTGTITIATTGGETIDGQSTQVMPVKFTSVDLISNNTGDWAIT